MIVRGLQCLVDMSTNLELPRVLIIGIPVADTSSTDRSEHRTGRAPASWLVDTATNKHSRGAQHNIPLPCRQNSMTSLLT
jgi:chloramphenicol 3-O-phosphotransferase